MGMNTFRVMGCNTNMAADMTPTHDIHSLAFFGISFTNPTEAVQTNSGAQSHSWKLKLKKNTSTTDTIVSVTQKA